MHKAKIASDYNCHILLSYHRQYYLNVASSKNRTRGYIFDNANYFLASLGLCVSKLRPVCILFAIVCCV